MTQKAKQSPQALLQELESIKNLLDNDMENIPLLKETVAEEAVTEEDSASLSTPTANTDPRSPLDPPKKQRASGDNPFLPQHIRERLNGASAPLAYSATQTSTNSSTMTAVQTTAVNKQLPPLVVAPTPKASSTLVDQLVAEYLPMIEAELRRRLQDKLQGK
ncbi:MAG: hypothetical protein KTR20_03425 [Cellvibrionaceae bacterium]|nr:hypothetical protein [Cellvibrionaceae bacterium]